MLMWEQEQDSVLAKKEKHTSRNVEKVVGSADVTMTWLVNKYPVIKHNLWQDSMSTDISNTLSHFTEKLRPLTGKLIRRIVMKAKRSQNPNS